MSTLILLYAAHTINSGVVNLNWAAIGVILTFCISALTVAYRIGGLDRSIKDVVNRVERIERKIDQEVQPRQMRIERKIDNQDNARRNRRGNPGNADT